MSRFPYNDENKTKMDTVAENLRGTSRSLDEELADEFGEGADITDFDTELLRHLDDQVMECECCGWWCETHEFADSDDQVCSDCQNG